MLVKAKESQIHYSKQSQNPPDFTGTVLDPLVKPKPADKSRSESFLEQLLLPDRRDDSPKADSAIIGQQSQPAVAEPTVINEPQEKALDVHKIVTEYRESINSMRKKEIT